MSDPGSVLRAVAELLTRAGAAPGTDFFVPSTGIDGVSSEHYGLTTTDDGGFEVYYRDMGQQQSVGTTRDAEQARAMFVDRVLELAGLRGRGPRAVRQPPSVPFSSIAPWDADP